MSSPVRPPADQYRLRFTDQIVVDVFPHRQEIRETAASPAVPKSTRDHFLSDQVIPRVLAHEGRLVLHGAAVRLGDRAIVILGNSGRGKSTLAASFGQHGATLLGDDAAMIDWRDEQPFVTAVYPSLRLLPNSLGALFSERPATSAVAPYTPKRRLDVAGGVGAGEGPCRVGAIFAIAPQAAGSAIECRPLSIAEACMALIDNSFALDPSDVDRARAKLREASRLAGAVPAFAIAYPRDYMRLPDVRAAMVAQLNKADGGLRAVSAA